MLPGERYQDMEEALRTALASFKLGMWTALPCIVDSFDPDALTCVLIPAVKGQTVDKDGVQTLVDIKPLSDIPVITPRGGGWTWTFPIKKGDEALAVFASRCIDGWWQSGGVQREPVFRSHGLSDAFALIGPFSQPTKITGWSTNSVKLRNDANDTSIELTDGNVANITAPAGIHLNAGSSIITMSAGTIQMTATAEIDATAPAIDLTGEVVVAGDLAATGSVGSNTATTAHDLGTHKHFVHGIQTGTQTVESDVPTG